jgi:ribose 5-phosphate isomerase A
MVPEDGKTDAREALKRAAARRAAEWIQEGMTLGLGSGSTVRHLLEHIGERRAAGAWQGVVGIPTSEETARQARALGIPLTTLEERPEVDLTIDGADEVDPELRLIKGLGGALLREKLVATASAGLVIMVDASKEVERLGTLAPLPIEVDPFGAAIQPGFLRGLGGEPQLRRRADGSAFVTDGGNHILDCRFPEGIDDPERLAAALDARPGIMEHGLFLGLATAVVVASEQGVRVRRAVAHAQVEGRS